VKKVTQLSKDESAGDTAEAQGAENLEQQKQWFEVTLASIGDGVITTNTEGRVTFLNPVAEALTGWTNAEAHSQPLENVFRIVNEDTLETVENPALRAMEEGVIFGLANHTRLISKSGKEVSIDDSGAPIRASDGKLLGAVLVFRDITERRRGERAHALLADIVDSSDDAIVSKSLEGIITSWNAAAERMFGYSSSEAVGKSITIIIPPELREEETSILSRLRQGQRIEHFETERLAKNGKRINISLTVSPVRNKRGKIIGASKIARDITDRIRAEKEHTRLLARERTAREHAEAASRAKDEFVAMISHEIRSPLNAILGWAQILRQGTLDSTAQENAIESIERNARAQAQLVSDLLDISRVITGKLRIDARPVDITSSLDAALESIRPAAEAKAIKIEVQHESHPTLITGDADRLQQVFWNLLSNAVKFTPRRGRVSVKIARLNSHLGIAVSDSGAGIGEDFLPFIFERFTQADTTSARKHAGLGLGLAIVRHLVELHGGTVTAESDGEGKGATFRITLPVRAIHERDADLKDRDLVPINAIADRIVLDQLRVLVVDDEVEARELLKMMLGAHGAEVQVASSAAEALALIDEWQPAIIVSDIGMPVQDGYAFIKNVRGLESDRRNVPAIALTAYARLEDRMRALAAGFQMHVPKPVEATELVMVIASLAKRM
jgi:PAS domain S-box-containing protein